MQNQVAHTILAQLGGNKFLAMTGSHSLCAEKNNLQFKVGKNPKKISAVTIELTPMDVYTVKFWKMRTKNGLLGFESTDHTDVYAEDLAPLFVKETGLQTRLF